MPEIVEIKKYCDFIKKHMKNINIVDVKILNGRYKTHKPFEGYNIIKHHLGSNKSLKILNVESKGKFIYMTFENDIILFCTLGLSGGWTFHNSNEKYMFPISFEFLNAKDIFYISCLKTRNIKLIREDRIA
jgi:formamidopyrimidine-DNA glycosylase